MSALPANIDKSGFHPGQYVGYDASGRVWRVRRTGSREWTAEPNCSNPSGVRKVRACTLTALADALSILNPVA